MFIKNKTFGSSFSSLDPNHYYEIIMEFKEEVDNRSTKLSFDIKDYDGELIFVKPSQIKSMEIRMAIG